MDRALGVETHSAKFSLQGYPLEIPSPHPHTKPLVSRMPKRSRSLAYQSRVL